MAKERGEIVDNDAQKLIQWKIWAKRFFTIGGWLIGIGILVILISPFAAVGGRWSIEYFLDNILSFGSLVILGGLLVLVGFITSKGYERVKKSIVKSSEKEKVVLDSLIRRVQNKDYRKYAAVFSALGEIGNARAVEPLTEALKDRDEHIRENAAGALGKIGDVRAVEPLTKALEDENKHVQKAAKEALDKIKAKKG